MARTGTTLVNSYYGEMYQIDNTNYTTVSVKDTWYTVTNFISGETHYWSVASSTLTHSSGAPKFPFLVLYSVSFLATADYPIEFGIFLNGSLLNNSVSKGVSRGGTASGTVSGAFIVELEGDDEINLKLRNRVDTADVLVQHANVCLRRID